uniref:Cytochrome b-c1 complex subunit 8 n=1 Tax=Peronospora matthiolae TaxID=2874970 RepID=A0AAV1UKW3_9STRA
MPPSVNLVKMWVKFGPEFGRTSRHLSPYEVHPVRSIITTIPYKTVRKIKENGPVLIPAILLLVGTVKWGTKANEEEHRTHWS